MSTHSLLFTLVTIVVVVTPIVRQWLDVGHATPATAKSEVDVTSLVFVGRGFASRATSDQCPSKEDSAKLSFSSPKSFSKSTGYVPTRVQVVAFGQVSADRAM